MAVLTSYKGLDVVEGASGDAGVALTNDFKELANRAPFTSTDDPTINDDSGDGFSAGSSWLNTTDQTVFMCTDATAGSAVWKSVFKRNGSSLTLVPDGDGSVDIDNLQFVGNTLSSTDVDGAISLMPNGNGNVGIGTQSPTSILHVVDSKPVALLESASSGESISLEFNEAGTKRGRLYYRGTGTANNYFGLINDAADYVAIWSGIVRMFDGGSTNTQFFYQEYQEGLILNDASTTPEAGLDVHPAKALQDTLKLTQSNDSEAFVNYAANSSADNSDPITTRANGATVQGHIRIKINGTDYWMPYYDAPTS